MKRLIIEVVRYYTITVDEDDEIVKEYLSEKELINHLVDYNFSILPVLEKGVVLEDEEIEDCRIISEVVI
jgi:hypothetical protein